MTRMMQKLTRSYFWLTFFFISTLQEYASSEELNSLKEEVSKLTRELEAKAAEREEFIVELNRMKEEQTQSKDLHTSQLKSVS